MASKSNIEWTDSDGSFNETRYQGSRVRWSQLVWYGNQREFSGLGNSRERGRRFEVLALKNIFTKVGLDSAIDLAGIGKNSPFDFVATLAGERVAVDVSSKWQKRVDRKEPLATALGLALYLILISPRDPSFFFFTPVRRGAKSIRVPFSLLRSMAEHLGEVGHGRHH